MKGPWVLFFIQLIILKLKVVKYTVHFKSTAQYNPICTSINREIKAVSVLIFSQNIGMIKTYRTLTLLLKGTYTVY